MTPEERKKFLESNRYCVVAYNRESGAAPLYGMANTIPDRGVVADAMKRYMDQWYRLR